MVQNDSKWVKMIIKIQIREERGKANDTLR